MKPEKAEKLIEKHLKKCEECQTISVEQGCEKGRQLWEAAQS